MTLDGSMLADTTKETAEQWGEVHRLSERYSDAEVMYGRARRLRQQLASDHPAVLDYQNDLAGTLNNLGLLYHSTKRPTQARAAYDEVISVREKLAREHSVLQIRIELAGAYNNMARLLRDFFKPADAVAWYARAAKAVDDLPPSAGAQTLGCLVFYGRARTLRQLARYAESRSDWDHVLDSPGCRSRADFAYDGAVAYAAFVTALARDPGEAGTFATRALALLRRAADGGYFNSPDTVSSLSTDDFAALRGRADFGAIVAEIRAGAQKRE